jgi:hypothetical protein
MSVPTLALGLYSQYGPIEINVALKEAAAADGARDASDAHREG